MFEFKSEIEKQIEICKTNFQSHAKLAWAYFCFKLIEFTGGYKME